MNQILYGPPGTGKTYIVREKAAEILGKGREDYPALVEQGHIAFVTFHQSYSYEDFVEGIRPVTVDGVVTYEIRKGIFRQMCDLAEAVYLETKGKNKDKPEKDQLEPERFVLIVDEINRANISRVFGELITLLEPDKRLGEDNEIRVRLPYSGDEFGVPPNLYLIGTMNTADRSIALLDTALRRRFEFVEMMPDLEVLRSKTSIVGKDGQKQIDLAEMLGALNKRVEWLYDRDHTIGHAFFCDVDTLAKLDAVFRRKVIPLLQEYFYEDWQKIGQALNDSSGEFFLRMDTLTPPKALSQDNGPGEPRQRYTVRQEFSADAFRNLYLA